MILEDNQRLRESLVDLAKRFPVGFSNHDDHKSCTSHTPSGHPKANYDLPLPARKEKKSYGHNRHNLIKESIHANN